MLIRFIAVLLSLLASMQITGCALIKPVQAKSTSTNEMLTGTVKITYSLGTINMISSNGATCYGEYPPPTSTLVGEAFTVSGIITCSDGRKGNWSVTGILHASNGMQSGQGFANVGGEKFKIIYGDFINVASF